MLTLVLMMILPPTLHHRHSLTHTIIHIHMDYDASPPLVFHMVRILNSLSRLVLLLHMVLVFQ